MPPVITKQRAVPLQPTNGPSALRGRATGQRTATAGSVIDRIGPVDFSGDLGIKLLLYGQSGSGKTTLWSTFPKPILCAVCSGGFRPGELRSVGRDDAKGIKQVTLYTSAELAELTAHVGGRYATFVLDHASGLQDLTLKEILGVDVLPAQKSWGLASQQQYGQSTMQCKELLRGMLNLPGHVVIIAQERTFGGSEDGEVSDVIRPMVGPGVTPSLAGWLRPACDYVCQCYLRPRTVKTTSKIGGKVVTLEKRVKGEDFCLRVGPHDVYHSKFRVPRGTKLPDCLVNPDYAQLARLVAGGG